MTRTVRWWAGTVFGVALATLIPFLVEKSAAPKGHAVLWILYVTLGISLVVWLVASGVAWGESPKGPKPLVISYSMDGESKTRVALRRGRPQAVLVSVGLKNPNPYNLEGVAINMLFPQGLRVERCGAHGETLANPKGHWLSTFERLADEPTSSAHKDYWADENVSIAGNGSKVLYFRLRLAQAGRIYLLTRVFGDVPEQEQTAALEISETGDMFLGSILNELIHDGEALAEGPGNAFTGNQAAYQRWLTELIFATAVLEDEDRKWWKAATRDEVPGSGDQWRSNIARRDLPTLYDLRRRIDRPANAVQLRGEGS